MTAPGQRYMPVPEGLDGERLDAALARMFGLSRSRAAELISDNVGIAHPQNCVDCRVAGLDQHRHTLDKIIGNAELIFPRCGVNGAGTGTECGSASRTRRKSTRRRR